MDLNSLWFILIGILFTGYFILEGFDFGVGIWLPFLGKNDTERRVVLNTIGPHWDGNEVWLITAGGAMFAAFPGWYATLFSGFYIPLLVILLALIIRGIGIEFRSKDDNPRWRSFWDWAICIGSFLPAFLWGVSFANFVAGVQIDAAQNFTGSFWSLINIYSILGGLTTLTGFMLHGALFLTLKTGDPIHLRARKVAGKTWSANAVIFLATIVATYFYTDILTKLGVNPGAVPIFAVLAVFSIGWFVRQEKDGWAFIMNTLAMLLTTATVFLILYPRVMVSSLDPTLSLTIYNVASGPTTLKTMSIVALIFVPLVLLYQGWSYWIFRKRITADPGDLHY